MSEIKKLTDKNGNQIYPETIIDAIPDLPECLPLSGGTMEGAINMANSTKGKISFAKTDGTLVDGIYITANNNLRVGNTNTKTLIHTLETPDVVYPDGNYYELLHRGNVNNIPYITNNDLDITQLEPGNYACIASRFINPPVPGDGGYIDIEVRENQNANAADPENPNIRKTIIVHYTYSERIFVGHIHNTYGLTDWIELKPSENIQVFYENERNNLYTKLNSVASTSTKTIGFITDTHYIRTGRGAYGMNGIRHIGNIIDALGNGIGDLIVHGGDIINGKDSDYTTELMEINRLSLQSPIPFFPCRGNHDDGSWLVDNLTDSDQRTYDKHINKNRWYKLVTSKYINKYGFVPNSDHLEESTYAYYDFPDVKLRCIMLDIHDFRKQDLVQDGTNLILDTIDTTIFQISQDQLDWFVDVALNMPDTEGWNIMVFSHIAWYSSSQNMTYEPVRNGYQIHRILKAFNEHISDAVNNSGQSYGTVKSFDFTNTNHRVVATVCGHRHKDEKFVKDGIQYIYCKESACTHDNENHMDPADTESYRELMNPDYEDSWTTFTVDTSNSMLYIHRFGSGKAFEESIDYANLINTEVIN